MTMKLPDDERIPIIIEIGNIIEDHCHTCPVLRHNRNTNKYCLDCQHFKRLRTLGDQLIRDEEEKKETPVTTPVKKKRGRKPKKITFTLEEYFEMREKEGLSDQEISEKYAISRSLLSMWRKSRGIAEERGRLKMTEKEYWSYKRQSMTDKEIMELYGVSKRALATWKKKHGITTVRRKSHEPSEATTVRS